VWRRLQEVVVQHRVGNGRNWSGAVTDAVGAQAFEPGGG
jgi:hypothetical protein